MNEVNKMRVISYDSRILNTQEQKLSTLDRELLAIVYALQIYEFLIIGSPHPIYIFTDHKLLLHCFAKKGNLKPRFYRAQMQLTKFSKLKIIHTPGKNLTVADMKNFQELKDIYIQTVVQNILILNLQIFVPQWESGIHQELLMHHGQMV